MPFDSTPRTVACLISMPGRRVPTSATGAFIPVTTLGAPQTIESGAAPPTLTLHRVSRSASGCFATSSTCPTTTLPKAGATGSTDSTSSPPMVSTFASSWVGNFGSTNDRSQCSENFIGRGGLGSTRIEADLTPQKTDPIPSSSAQIRGSNKLTQKSQVAVVEQAQIVDAVAKHGQPVGPHAEGEAHVFFAVQAAGLQHVGMHLAASGYLEPPAVAADAAAGSATEHATHVHFRRGFGKREERRAKARAQPFVLEELSQEIGQHTLQIGEAHVLVDPESLDLVKHRRVRGIRIDTVHPARCDDLDWRAVALHVTHLDWRSMCPQQQVLPGTLHVERIVH